ncbi:RNA polymerase sigma factor [Kitasatospora purpeofusca]|uniref:RNA polymerase sigma factor n=1 Tax=Kitasatospora purpeofusca TaxID=67352 RepID=UPI0022541D7E|nr:RNA polymerase sigma factor [Kitasatospora purpeofusca]MCX4756803.1 RNA polymerase sigma factor [Kitasatospora purpeofusca]WSR35417.1 RNA polymerase sigma factor [Kitasatospora purpeofusca]WSR43737.1 RNA polymerase sigma factor [Kitasatospora purpeofusca]
MFTELLPRLQRAAVRMLGDPFGAGDVVHEAYLRIARNPARFLGHPRPYAYAFTAMANVVRDEWRRDRRRLRQSEALEDVGPAGVLAAVGGWGGGCGDPSGGGVAELQAHWEVVRLLRCLTVKQARVVLLVDLDGYSLEEAAELLGVHRSTLAVTRRRALDRLRNVLERERESPAGAGSGVRRPSGGRSPDRRPDSRPGRASGSPSGTLPGPPPGPPSGPAPGHVPGARAGSDAPV